MSKDNLYSKPIKYLNDFVFNRQVVDVFDDMINRSVPGYAAIIEMVGVLAGQYAQSNSRCYDLGCSLGACTFSMAKNIQSDCEIIAVDNSQAMVDQLHERKKIITEDISIDVRCADLRDVEIKSASVVVMNFTLQFISIEERLKLLRRIYDGLNTNGILIISEKIRFEDEMEDQRQQELHHAFKRLNGYSDLEISQKRNALEKVLIPDTLKTHQGRLKQAGFGFQTVWFQCFNFVSMIALKI